MLFLSGKIKWKMVVITVPKKLIKRKQCKDFIIYAYFKAKQTQK